MHNIKYILVALFAASFANVMAQDDKSKSEFRVRVGYDFSVDKGGGGTFSLLPEIGWNLSDQFYLGIVSGVLTSEKFKNPSIPVFVHPEFSFNVPGKITPFIGLEGGITVDTKKIEDHGSDIVSGAISPMIGIKTPIGRNTDFSLSFGYTRSITSGEGSGGNSLGFKAGINFGSNGKGFKSVVGNCMQSIEIETLTAAEDKGDEGTYYKRQGFLGARYSFLFPIIDNLYLGPSVGVGLQKYEYGYSGKEDDSSTQVYYYVLARARYTVKQLTFAKKFYPFAQVEGGIGGFNDAFFAYNAAVGISYEVSSKHSIDLSIGYNTAGVEQVVGYREHGDDVTKGVLRLALGYTF